MKKKTLFASKLDINLRNKPDVYYIWSVVLYGSETWALPKVDQKSSRLSIQLNAQLDYSKRVLKFTLNVLLHVSV
jgi:hypothetical protein